jgi:hypothetical protein
MNKKAQRPTSVKNLPRPAGWCRWQQMWRYDSDCARQCTSQRPRHRPRKDGQPRRSQESGRLAFRRTGTRRDDKSNILFCGFPRVATIDARFRLLISDAMGYGHRGDEIGKAVVSRAAEWMGRGRCAETRRGLPAGQAIRAGKFDRTPGRASLWRQLGQSPGDHGHLSATSSFTVARSNSSRRLPSAAS